MTKDTLAHAVSLSNNIAKNKAEKDKLQALQTKISADGYTYNANSFAAKIDGVINVPLSLSQAQSVLSGNISALTTQISTDQAALDAL